MTDYESLTASCRERVLAGLSDAPCSEILASLFGRGQLLRPRLVFAATEAVGGRPSDVMAAAEAIELLHGASLIHDDIVDAAATRRGLAAVHLRVAPGAAIVLADYLLFHAFRVLCRPQLGRPAASTLRAVSALSYYAEACSRGQVQELQAASDTCGEAEYLQLARLKTGAQFEVAAQLGPILLGASEDDLHALATFGAQIGIAYQIHDDVLDLVGDAQLLGKPVGNSLELDRPILPIIYLHAHGSKDARATFLELQRLDQPVAEVGRLLESEGMISLARATQKAHVDRAVEALERLRPSAAVTALGEWARSLADSVARPANSV